MDIESPKYDNSNENEIEDTNKDELYARILESRYIHINPFHS